VSAIAGSIGAWYAHRQHKKRKLRDLEAQTQPGQLTSLGPQNVGVVTIARQIALQGHDRGDVEYKKRTWKFFGMSSTTELITFHKEPTNLGGGDGGDGRFPRAPLPRRMPEEEEVD
jgi:hypothetical protein